MCWWDDCRHAEHVDLLKKRTLAVPCACSADISRTGSFSRSYRSGCLEDKTMEDSTRQYIFDLLLPHWLMPQHLQPWTTCLAKTSDSSPFKGWGHGGNASPSPVRLFQGSAWVYWKQIWELLHSYCFGHSKAYCQKSRHCLELALGRHMKAVP